MRYIVASVEDGIACLESNEQKNILISIECLPADIKEGDIIDSDGNMFTVNKKETMDRRKSMYSKYKNLFNK